jgi:hypothetical protein
MELILDFISFLQIDSSQFISYLSSKGSPWETNRLPVDRRHPEQQLKIVGGCNTVGIFLGRVCQLFHYATSKSLIKSSSISSNLYQRITET